MRWFIVTFMEEGKVRTREVIADDEVVARATITSLQGSIILRIHEVCDGCEGAISEGYESPLNGDNHYCEMCTALDAFAKADIETTVVFDL